MPVTPDILTGLVPSLGIAGVLVWYLYYTTTKSNPEKDKQHREEITVITDKFASTCSDITDKFACVLKDEREYRKEEVNSLKTWIKSEASCRYSHDHFGPK